MRGPTITSFALVSCVSLAAIAGGGCRNRPLADTSDAGGGTTGGGTGGVGGVGSTGGAGARASGSAGTPGSAGTTGDAGTSGIAGTTGGAGAAGGAVSTGTAGGGGEAARTLSFRPATAYTTDSSVAVALGDLNGDGMPDVAIAASGAGGQPAANLLLNDGSGGFSVSGGFSGRFQAIALGDLNGDGWLDIAGTGLTPQVLWNSGDATFRTGVSLSIRRMGSFGIAAAELNGDGRADLAIAEGSPTGGVLGVVVADETNRFRGVGDYPIGGGLYAMAASDLDGDGDNDLVVAGAASGLHVLLNRGDATFDPATIYAVTTTPSFAIADLDGDGRPDLAVARGAAVGVLRNNGDGTFATPVDHAIDASAVAAGDLDGDGRPDLAVATPDQTDVRVMRNRGDGFAAPVAFPAGKRPRSLAIGDMNGDARLDVVVAGFDGVSVLLNDGR